MVNIGKSGFFYFFLCLLLYIMFKELIYFNRTIQITFVHNVLWIDLLTPGVCQGVPFLMPDIGDLPPLVPQLLLPKVVNCISFFRESKFGFVDVFNVMFIFFISLSCIVYYLFLSTFFEFNLFFCCCFFLTSWKRVWPPSSLMYTFKVIGFL